ncbi:hypothetical protein [Occallatibacter riparius]|uniref:Uncharacterized protein n=1 Tax=Occallatibacter riparius TaxID=1002689 RepID=A0A9J7BMG9_9BACT|nr:hypothetical protein [Occallatibacter riparius]UWZ82102.1 hypothetical protein MOP44_16145 [Occallatibacter riparius]
MASIEHAPAHAGSVYPDLDAKRAAEQDRTHRARQKQSLELQRENILSQRTSNPGRRAALEAALKQIEAEIEKLG